MNLVSDRADRGQCRLQGIRGGTRRGSRSERSQRGLESGLAALPFCAGRV